MIMAGPENGNRWPGINELVEAYESAQARDGRAEIGEYLPSSNHPQFLAAVCELVRVDLEYSWKRGRPNRLEHYQGRFPDLFRDKGLVQEIAFEEYRLRQQAGEDPSPLEYRRRFAVDCLEWPSSALNGLIPEREPRGPDPRTNDAIEEAEGDNEEALQAASAYRSYRISQADDPAGLEAMFASRRVSRGHADLFRDLHRSDPRVADRLARAVEELPRAGSDFLSFHLSAELGRGAFGRVFLARQGDLADRPVALKISANVTEETHALAQLQHTNIVPIHSVHRCGSLQAVCMPYLGPTTLANVLSDLKRHQTLPDSGAGLLSSWNPRDRPSARASEEVADAAEKSEPAVETPSAAEGRPAVQIERLRGLGYVQAVLWLAARLADGLAHAHERGILHRDLKPANVLFSDDGEPLLLDFNMAADTKLRGHASAAMIGGTLPYMAPEHLEAFHNGGQSVDARSDIFSLGVILYELLTGRHPFPTPRGPVDEVLPQMIADRQVPPPGMRQSNKRVSPAVEAIVRRCLNPDPARRYQTARALQEDIQRHLDDLPLKHTSEPSFRERVGKWVRRHPRLMSATSVGLFATCFLAIVTTGLLVRQGQLRRLEASESFRTLSDEVRQADFLLGSRDADPRQLEEGMALCQNALGRYHVLEDPSWLTSGRARPLADTDRRRLREDIGEILFLWARAVSWQVGTTADASKRAELIAFALRLNTLAEGSYDREAIPRAWWLQRADLEALAGHDSDAQRLREAARAVPLRTPKERLMMISDRLDKSPRRELFAFMRGATSGGRPGVDQLDTSDYASWLMLGNVYVQLSRPDEAASCYGIGISLRPDLYWSYFNRGLLSLEQKDFAQALVDFDRMIALRPDLTVAYINRALARLGLGYYQAAIDDLTRALESSECPTRALFLRARARDRLGDREGAQRDRAEGLRLQPEDELSWITRGLAKLPADPQGALADFDAALELNPHSQPALQNKASVLSEQLGRTEEAVRVLDTAIEHHPDSVNALAGRGVLLGRLGRREAALSDAHAALAIDDSAGTLYQVAGLYALTSRQNPDDRLEALRLMAAALRKDSSWLKVVPTDPDLDAVRDQPDFLELLRASAVVAQKEAPVGPPFPPAGR
jgi:eukaryotic-like serine/threonine-protein kinase